MAAIFMLDLPESFRPGEVYQYLLIERNDKNILKNSKIILHFEHQGDTMASNWRSTDV